MSHFLSLPLDITLEISTCLSQNDLLSLSRTCKTLHLLLEPIIYHKVVVNSKKKVYTTEQKYLPISVLGTQISSLYCLHLFLKKTSYAKHTRLLKFDKSIPDSCEFVLVELLCSFLSQSSNLREFFWLTEVFKLPLHALRSNTNLRVLEGNFTFTEKLELKYLEALNLGNFNENCIAMIDYGANLTKLGLYNHHLVIDENMHRAFPKKALELTELTLKNIALSSSDIVNLTKTVNLKKVKRLTIDNCVEMVYESESGVKRIKGCKYLWDMLVPELLELQHLEISNFQNELGTADLVFEKLITWLPTMGKLRSCHLCIPCANDSKKYLQPFLARINGCNLESFSIDVHSTSAYFPHLSRTLQRFSKLTELQMRIHSQHIANVLAACKALAKSNIQKLALQLIQPSTLHTSLHAKFDTLIHRDFLNYYESLYHAPAENKSVGEQFRNYSFDFKRCFKGLRSFLIHHNDMAYTYSFAE